MPVFTGLVTPNYGQLGTEVLPAGNRHEAPYGEATPTSAAPTDSVFSMAGRGPDSAADSTGYRPDSNPAPYRPAAGRADRLGANIVGGGFDTLGSGGYSKGATQRI